LCGLNRDARLQPRDNRQIASARFTRLGWQDVRQPHVDRLADERAGFEEETEPGRHDADDRLRPHVQLDRATDDGRVAAETALPNLVAQNHGRRFWIRAFGGRKDAADHRRHAEHGKIRRRDELRNELDGIAEVGQVGPRFRERGEIIEDRGAFSPPNEIRGTNHIRSTGEPRIGFPYGDDSIRIVIREPLEEHRVHNRENRRVRADAEREREHGHDGEAGRPEGRAYGVSQVLKKFIHADWLEPLVGRQS
jgi:hypothetical protein